MWKLSSVHLNNQWIKEVAREIINFLETNENENTTYQNLWDEENTVLKGKFTAINVYITNEERS